MSETYKGYRVPKVLIGFAVRYYLRYKLSLRDVRDILLDRGLEVSHETIRAWIQGYLEIKMGPLSFETFQGFLKTGGPYNILCEILRFYLSPAREFRIRLSLRKGETKVTRLGKESNLGWTSWLSQAPLPREDEQVVLYPR